MSREQADPRRSIGWVLLNSVGILWPIFSVGALGGIAFLYRGIRMRKRGWIITGAIMLAMGISFFAMIPGNGVKSINGSTGLYDLLMVGVILMWFGGPAAIALTNRSWLRFRAHETEVRREARRTRDYRQFVPPVDHRPVFPGQSDNHLQHTGFPQSAGYQTVPDWQQQPAHRRDSTTNGTESPVTSTAEQSPQMLEINSATKVQLLRLTGNSEATAKILEARDKHGTFSSFEELIGVCGIAPHLLLPLRHQMAFSTGPAPDRRYGSPRGQRRLDL